MTGTWRPLTEGGLPDPSQRVSGAPWDRGQAVSPPGSSQEQQQEEGGAKAERGPQSHRKPVGSAERRALTEGAADRAIGGHSQGARSRPPSPPGGQGGKALSREPLQTSSVRMASTDCELDEALAVLSVTVWRACVLSHFSRVRPSVTPRPVARQAPLSMGFSILEWAAMPSSRGSS